MNLDIATQRKRIKDGALKKLKFEGGEQMKKTKFLNAFSHG